MFFLLLYFRTKIINNYFLHFSEPDPIFNMIEAARPQIVSPIKLRKTTFPIREVGKKHKHSPEDLRTSTKPEGTNCYTIIMPHKKIARKAENSKFHSICEL
jgi:hypothetical protein